ncbi:dephospho-CoA kinase [Neisseriaceae bacterium ESL0693]|nr:dephospho-CoA kinase [Neisseriaceae bacterium ESL0693]
MTFWIGLSGGIGSGKSTVADYFARLNVPVLSADAIAHELTAADGMALPFIHAQWGDEVFLPDQTLNRSRLRALVFEQPQQKQILENILHPLIWQQLQKAQQSTDHGHHYGMIEIPLLIEKPQFQQLVDQILIVEAPESTRIRRIQNRSGLSENIIRVIISQQADAVTRQGLASQIIHNDGNQSQLQQQVMRLHRFYQALNLPQP